MLIPQGDLDDGESPRSFGKRGGLVIEQGEGEISRVIAGVVIALTITVAGAIFTGSGSAVGGDPFRPKAVTDPSAVAAAKSRGAVRRCPDARGGLVFYRVRYSHHRTVRGVDTPWPAGRKPHNCPDAHYLADVWQSRSFEQRTITERWLKARAAERARERQHPKWIALRLLNGDREEWGCLLYISSVENARMDPTLDFGGGHGNVYEAYGIPQAYPGTKMASAGPDWRTNPETQLRWMIGYCRERYGSVCGAAYSRRVNGMY